MPIWNSSDQIGSPTEYKMVGTSVIYSIFKVYQRRRYRGEKKYFHEFGQIEELNFFRVLELKKTRIEAAVVALLKQDTLNGPLLLILLGLLLRRRVVLFHQFPLFWLIRIRTGTIHLSDMLN